MPPHNIFTEVKDGRPQSEMKGVGQKECGTKRDSGPSQNWRTTGRDVCGSIMERDGGGGTARDRLTFFCLNFQCNNSGNSPF